MNASERTTTAMKAKASTGSVRTGDRPWSSRGRWIQPKMTETTEAIAKWRYPKRMPAMIPLDTML